jgi:bifunctional non-homologous end joining protein LigD
MSRRVLPRSTDSLDPSVSSRALVPKRGDPRQADLFGPKFILPCKPSLSERLPVGDSWQYEFKHEGYRAQAHLAEGQVRVFTKNGYDWTEHVPAIVAAVEGLEAHSAVIDGEVVIEDGSGLSDLFAVHAALTGSCAPEAILHAFDLLELNGTDLRSLPLADRRAILDELLLGAGTGLAFSTHLDGDGEVMLKHACAMGLEGIVAKRKDAPYRSGRSEAWLKVKCTITERFAVIDCKRDGRSGIRALAVATLKDAELTACGWVGSGLSNKACKELRIALDAGWPIVIDVEHRGRTPSGELSHPVFKGWHLT